MAKKLSFQEVFGKRVRQERIRQGYSQLRLASGSGVGLSCINNIERAKQNITMDTIGKVCNFLKVEVKDMFDLRLLMEVGELKKGRKSGGR